MTHRLSIKSVGVSVSAVLAVPYLLVMLASLFLVGRLTTGSWQAVFLGIDWSILGGFEIGLLATVIVGFAFAVVFVPVYNTIRARLTVRLQTSAQPSQPSVAAGRSWAFWLLTACLVLPVMSLAALRVLAPVFPAGHAPSGADANVLNSGAQGQPVNMGPTINTADREAEPSFTANGRTMYFNCYSGDLCVAHLIGSWEAGSWTPPERLGAPISTAFEEVEPIISADGDKLYFTSRRPGGRLAEIPFLSPFINVFIVIDALTGRAVLGGLGLSDVWVSEWVDGAWTAPQNLNNVAGEPPINTPFDDHCLFLSADGNEAFWTSTRPGGLGDDDIWTSRRVDGVWTEPENLGPNINSPGSEHTSIPTPDGRSLYVTTTRAEGFGGEDNYVTTRGDDGTWGPLANLGPLVNGPGDDRCPAWTPDHKIFLFDSVRPGGIGARDIWWVHSEDVVGYPLASADKEVSP
jgi:hypothetical protein